MPSIASKAGLMYHLTCLLYAPYLGKLKDPKIMNLASNCRHPLWFQLLCQKLIIVVPGMKVNGHAVLPWCFTLSADAASDQACCVRYVCLSTRQCSIASCKNTIKQLQQEKPDFIGPDLWPANSPDLNLVDYKVWGVMQQRVYECRMNNVDELKAVSHWPVEQSARRTLLTRPSTTGESN